METTKKKVTRKKRTTKKKVAKKVTAKKDTPQVGESRAKGRPKRPRSIGEFRDLLSVEGLDPNFRYRWVKGASEGDKRLFDAGRAGWEMVSAVNETLVIGGDAVAKSSSLGSVYRIPANRAGLNQEYLYLMRIPEDYAIEVDAYKQAKVDEVDAELQRKRSSADVEAEMGQYGETTIDHEFRVQRNNS